MKRFVSVLLALSLLLAFSCTAYAASLDDLQKGWGTSTYPSSYINSWWKVMRDFEYNLTTGWTSSTNPTGYTTSWYSVVRTFLSNIYNKILTIDSNVDSIESNIKLWNTDISLISEIFTKLSDLSSTVSESNSSLLNSESWLSEIYNYTVENESNTSTVRTDLHLLFSGWRNPQTAAYINKSPSSWFGIIGQRIDTLYLDLARDTTNVTSMDDSSFGNSQWYKGVYGTLYRLQQVLANDDDLQMRQDTEDNRQQFKDDFLDSSADNSVKPSDISSVASLGSGLKSNFDTGVSATSLFDFLSQDLPFSWFTQECKKSMVSVSGSSSLRSPVVSSPYGNYANERMQEYYNLLEEVKE